MLPRKNDRSPGNASIERLGVGAQFENSATLSEEQSEDANIKLTMDIDQLKTRLFGRAVVNSYPQSRDEWIEHLTVPLRYTSILKPHHFDSQDPFMELSSTPDVNLQCVYRSGGSKCLEALGTRSTEFKQSERNLDALIPPGLSRKACLAASRPWEELFQQHQSPLRSITEAVIQPLFTESDGDGSRHDRSLQISEVDKLLAESSLYRPLIPPAKFLSQCSNVSAAHFLSDSEIPETTQLSIGPDRNRRASTNSALESHNRTGLVGEMHSDFSSSNASSTVSDISVSSHASWSGRKGRRRRLVIVQRRRKSTFSQRYECSWCLIGFAKRYDWRRHEESQHAPQIEWICMPEGAQITERGQTYCLFCKISNPDRFHLTHNHEISSCLERPLKDRKFDRKDHLVQHLSRWHDAIVANNAFLSGTISTWQRRIHSSELEPLWDCGFCRVRSMTWDQRFVHVAKHMEDGLNMLSWQQPDIYFCTQSGCNRRFQSYSEWRTHEEVIHEHDLDLWTCKRPSNLSPAIACNQIFTTQEAIKQHLYSDHETLDTCQAIRVACPGADCPYDLAYNIFWCGFCRTVKNVHGSPHDDDDRFGHIEKKHIRPRRRIDSWHAIGTQDMILLFYAVSATLMLAEQESDGKSQFWRYRLNVLRQWLRTRHNKESPAYDAECRM